jgi:hypothetical protein
LIMSHEPRSPNSIKFNHSKPLKCCGLGCDKSGKYELKIRWIKKCGFFCKNCADNIKSSGLVYEDEN